MARRWMQNGALVALAAAGLAACSPKLPDTIDDTALVGAIGKSIGSPSTCVIIADAQGKQLWRGGGYITCQRNLPTCEGAVTTAGKVLDANIGKPARFMSCPSSSNGVNTVGWAMGPVPTSDGKPNLNLTYIAVMEGNRALPGLEIQERVEQAFKKAGF